MIQVLYTSLILLRWDTFSLKAYDIMDFRGPIWCLYLEIFTFREKVAIWTGPMTPKVPKVPSERIFDSS